ncbi:WecB/TagA/CpsF family glycosyltransferase [Actinomycetospora sp. TBRC 11914]|uniref:WecB/TagA/CpsF family glycosyltransferase n=1 Tax=Actinomycetospora sp. TBRC 11914 TaxID=2729387 RepID=UPI00145C644C|nr:WecB/TagA/CpsF family glycosyltransferase [Actinomycetospora sp. TBRC 11914]NMO90295.1 WecB/TagA/CpsF family glycosyltransferase [Actinomycetospora sp. TBRC 11914]
MSAAERLGRASADGPPRVDVLGVRISCLTLDSAVEEVSGWVVRDEHRYVCVTGVHGVMECRRDPQLLRIHNRSGLTTPDGMPMVWSARWAGRRDVSRVYGPDLMAAVLARAAERGWSSFFYGGSSGTAELLAERLTARFPGLRIAGTWTPPFRPLTPDEDAEVVRVINDSGAQLVWVGLSTPKQERWLAEHVGTLRANALFGVGAAFDLQAGTIPQAPRWMQRSGLEWAYRLGREPRRLWRRYLRNNPAFVLKILAHPPRLAGTIPDPADTVGSGTTAGAPV